jgi:MoaA/NifB/PqqE/SkfB family radical SAM enzyme
MSKETMTFDEILSLVSTGTSHDLIQNTEKILRGLQRLGLLEEQQKALLQSIEKIRAITNNPKTRAGFFRSFFRIIQEEIGKDGRGSSIIIEITKKCGKNCTHCYSKFTDRIQSMSDETLNTIVAFAKKNFKHIFLTGGEPTLDPRVCSLAEKNPDIMFFIFTNGSTLSSSYARRFSELGNVIPLIGIDGASASTHDAFRGKGSYNEAMTAITNLNSWNVSWGFISLVTEQNAREVLGQEFLENMVRKGAIIARFLEYLPVGPKPLQDCILSGETYYFLEKRKNEIIKTGTIYMQDIGEKKCNGLLFFSVSGDIKNCFCFHYAKYNVAAGDIKECIEKTRKDWTSYTWEGECPLYSDPIGFKNHLTACGWKNRSTIEEPYLNDVNIASRLRKNYARFLKIKAERGLWVFS